MKLSVLFPFMLSILCILGACTHEPSEGPFLPKPGLSVYREAIPVSELQEPGCEPQMPIDSMWHWNRPRDSNYIRDLVVNPKNPSQWVYIQQVIKRGEDWNILWYVDLEKRERRQLDSVSWSGYGDLTWGGRNIAFTLGGGIGILNVDNGSHWEVLSSTGPNLSPKGDFFLCSKQKKPVRIELDESGLFNEKASKINSIFALWKDDYLLLDPYHRRSSNKLELHKYNVQTDSLTVGFVIDRDYGVITECLSLSQNKIYLSGHNSLDLETGSFQVFYPYCKRQYLERIIPLKDTREYLTIKSYKETVDSHFTHFFHHFHVFDENWENERRVTLNFDF